ncbi:MAG: pyruvate ferredoxin oxidoreductase [Prevotella sp.]|nr:pyruvate ferredoxin oxidoreductase [Prevotella sp.]
MNYQYIEQLLERYWQCETTVEEEKILRTFFSQKDVPAALLPYKDLFTYEQQEREEVALGDDFDSRMMELINEPTPVKARTIKLTERLKPLFKAAAVVAIILTLGNAVQMAFLHETAATQGEIAVIEQNIDGPSVAKADSARIDTLNAITGDVPFIK